MSIINPLAIAKTVPSITGTASQLKRYQPEPKSRVKFTDVLKQVAHGVKNTVSQATGYSVAIDPEYQQFLEKQMEFQEQMMMVSMVSNSERTKHETRMAAVRNLRVA